MCAQGGGGGAGPQDAQEEGLAVIAGVRGVLNLRWVFVKKEGRQIRWVDGGQAVDLGAGGREGWWGFKQRQVWAGGAGVGTGVPVCGKWTSSPERPSPRHPSLNPARLLSPRHPSSPPSLSYLAAHVQTGAGVGWGSRCGDRRNQSAGWTSGPFPLRPFPTCSTQILSSPVPSLLHLPPPQPSCSPLSYLYPSPPPPYSPLSSTSQASPEGTRTAVLSRL